jgi:hypothetical protein
MESLRPELDKIMCQFFKFEKERATEMLVNMMILLPKCPEQ